MVVFFRNEFSVYESPMGDNARKDGIRNNVTRMRFWMRFCSFAVIGFLVYVHLGPARWQPPRTGLGWELDHFLGYFAATSIVWLGWPKRPFVVGGLLMVTAVVLEALQVFTPDRHADFHAALYGACGALTQALLAALLIRVRATYYGHYL